MSAEVLFSDPLTDVLRMVRLEGALFSRASCGAPFGVHTKGGTDGIFHVILRGNLHARPLDGAPSSPHSPPESGRPNPDILDSRPAAPASRLRLPGFDLGVPGTRGDRTLVTVDAKAGDLLVFPHGHAHALTDAPTSATTWIRALPTVPGDDGLPTVIAGSGGEVEILCGTLRFGAEARELLLPHLPPLLHAPAAGALGGWLDATVRQLADEVRRRSPGSELVVSRLAEVLFVQAVRAWVTAPSTEGGPSWLRALGDPPMARALSLLHGAPERAWSVDHLARRAGLSRTVFYDRFSMVVGEPPAAYLLRWRMTLARRALLDPRATIPDVATRVGYGSEAAFNRAFKRVVGVPPGVWRRTAAAS